MYYQFFSYHNDVLKLIFHGASCLFFAIMTTLSIFFLSCRIFAIFLNLHQLFMITSSQSTIFFSISLSAFFDHLLFASLQSLILPSIFLLSFHFYLILLTSLFSLISSRLFSNMGCYMILLIISHNFCGFWLT